MGTAGAELARWCGGTGWHVGAASYDRHVDRVRFQAKRKGLDAVTESHRRILANLRETAENELAKYADSSGKDSAATLASWERTAELLERVIKLERLAFGGTTENTGQGIQASDPHAPTWDLDALSLEDLERLDEIRRKARAKEPKPVDESGGSS
jgi:hypothetical protein